MKKACAAHLPGRAALVPWRLMDSAKPRLPFSNSPWLTPDRIALASVATFAVAWALPAIWWISEARGEIRGGRRAMAAVVASTVLLSLLLVRRALRAASPMSAALWCALGGVACGVLNAGLCLGSVELVHSGDPGAFFGGLFLGSFFGGIYGGPLGLAFGAAYAVVVCSAVSARLDPSHDGADRVLVAAGLWLALAGAALLPAALASPVVLPPAALVAAGVAIAGAAAARRRARGRWLARAAAGRDERFRVEPRRGGDDEVGLVPLIREGGESDHVVLRRARAGDPYRGVSGWVPAALAALPPVEAAPSGAADAT